MSNATEKELAARLQNPDLMSAIPDRLDYERKRLRLSKQGMANGMLIDEKTVTRYLCGALFPSALELARLQREEPRFDVLFVVTGRRERAR